MLQSGAWPSNSKYITCDDYDGTNTPDRVVDLKSFFVGVTEPTSYGDFSLVTKANSQFNGYSFMKFEMDISAVSVRSGASVNTKNLGTWSTGLQQPLNIRETEEIKNLTAATVYRVFTVVVCSQYKAIIFTSSGIIIWCLSTATTIYN